MTDNQCLAIMAAILRNNGMEATKSCREAANLAAICGLEVSKHTQEALKLRPIYADDFKQPVTDREATECVEALSR